MVRAGAHFTSLGDSLSGPDVISPQMHQRFARPFQQRLVSELAAEGVFTAIHICGDAGPILPQLARYDRCGFELDYKTSATAAKQTVGRRHVLLGNIDPSGVLTQGDVDQVEQAAEELIRAWKPGGRFILNAGCTIPAAAPAENVRALVAAAARYGSYESEPRRAEPL